MAWQIRGIGKSYRQAAEDAAGRAGLPLGEWLDRVILAHPAGPTRSDAEAEITRALEALENRIAEADARLGAIVRPLTAEVDRLEKESRALRDGKTSPGISRQLARIEAIESGNRLDRDEIDSDAPHGAAGAPTPFALRARTDDRADEADPAHEVKWGGTPVPHLSVLRRRRILRFAGGIGAMVMVAGSVAAGVWLWLDHERLPDGEAAPLPGLVTPSTDRTPPQVIGQAQPRPGAESDRQTAAAIALLRDRAQAHDHEAEYDLGVALLNGDGVAPNPREAGEWIASAALAGFGPAQLKLGQLYADGKGYARDPQQAFFWISSAAEQGITEAQYLLGMLYTQGNGVERSHALAAQWLRKAGAKGHGPALYQLGLIFELGLDYRANAARALEWYRKAAAAGSAPARGKVAALEAGGVRAPAAAAAKTAPAGTAPAPAKAAPAAARPTDAAASGVPPDAALSRAEIAELQRLLTALALDPGPADGIPGAKTFDAIKLYQQMAGLPANGQPSRRLLEQIREVAGVER